jgi:hypothetical protein
MFRTSKMCMFLSALRICICTCGTNGSVKLDKTKTKKNLVCQTCAARVRARERERERERERDRMRSFRGLGLGLCRTKPGNNAKVASNVHRIDTLVHIDGRHSTVHVNRPVLECSVPGPCSIGFS